MKLSIDLDETALSIRDELDLAYPHVYGSQESARPQSALKTVTVCWAKADLILDNLSEAYDEEVQRFTSLRTEARKLIMAFWSVYKLFPIERTNGHTVTAQVEVSNGHTKPIMAKPRSVRGKRAGTYDTPHGPVTFLDEKAQSEIRAYVKGLGRPMTTAERNEILSMYRIGSSTLYRIIQGHR